MPMRSVAVGSDPSHRVQTAFKDGLKSTPFDGVTTLHELAMRAYKNYGHCDAMAQREYIGQKSAKVKEFGEVSSRTFDQVKEISLKFGASLRKIGMVPSADKATLDQLTTPCTLAIFENTSPEWLISALGGEYFRVICL